MFVLEVPYFNLDHIYDSGQVPRWIKLKEGKYVIPFKDKALKIEQQRDKYDLNRYRIIMSCSEDDFYDIWFEYFDLRMDCLDVNTKIKHLGGKLKIPAVKGSGIHIMHQDCFEAYVFAKLIAYAGYEKAAIAMNHIAEVCGIKHIQSMREAGKVAWYEWPTPEMILDKYNKLKRMGKMNAWLKRLCEAVVNDGYKLYSENALFKLFGMHDISQFPVAGIENILRKNFGVDPDEFACTYLDNIDEKGVAYMYIVHYVLSRQREANNHGLN